MIEVFIVITWFVEFDNFTFVRGVYSSLQSAVDFVEDLEKVYPSILYDIKKYKVYE